MERINVIHAVMLGIVQGVTEFLPVSSSAHLVIFQKIFNIDVGAGPIVAFDVCLHIGTLFAVLLALKGEIGVIIKGFFSQAGLLEMDGGFSPATSRKAVWMVTLGTIPAVIIGFSLKDFFENLFTTTLPVGFALLATGVVLFATRFVKRNEIKLQGMRWWHALLIGLAQAVAIIPGISRSGSTIATGLFTGLDHQLAAKFSFLLSVIAIGGAGILEWENLRFISHENILSIVLGTFFAFVVGYICVKWMLAILRGNRFSLFALYCWIVGALTIFASF